EPKMLSADTPTTCTLLKRLTTWTSYHLSRSRERFLPLHKDFLPTAGVIERVLAQHGHAHAEESGSNATEGASVSPPLGLEGSIQTREIRIALSDAVRHMIERVAQTRVTATPHHYLTAFPTLLRDGRHAALRASQ